MNRTQLEHAIRAVADLTGEKTLIIIGSQAILGQFPNAPEDLLISREIDIFSPARPETADRISGAFGADTHFERTHDFQIDGVGPTTATVPGGWKDRLIPVCNANTNRATGWCLEIHDIAVAKYAANRHKDRRYTTDLWRHGMLDEATLQERMRNAPVSKVKRKSMLAAARRDQAEAVIRPPIDESSTDAERLSEMKTQLSRTADAALEEYREQTGQPPRRDRGPGHQR